MNTGPRKSLQPLMLTAVLVVPLALCHTLSLPHPAALGVFLTTVVLWLTELIPLAATALLVPVLAALSGALPVSSAFSQFGSRILFLFLGCFLLARAMQKHGWDKRMAYWILSSQFAPRSPAGLICLIGGICWLLSMWVSNTATAAMMTPVCLGIISSTRSSFSDPGDAKRFRTRLLLSCAFCSSMGGLATPVGSPPNLIAIEMLAQTGTRIGFLDWCSFALPLSALMLIAILALMHIRYPIQSSSLTGLKTHARDSLKQLGPLKREEFQVATIFGLAVFAWILPGVLSTFSPDSPLTQIVHEKFDMSLVGITAGLSLFALRGRSGEANLVWSDAQKVDWGTIMLFGGGLTLGLLLNSSGLAATLGEIIFQPELGLILLISSGVLFSILMSEFASNTASAAIILPLLLAALDAGTFSPHQVTAIVVASTIGASFGFMLPVSTPPNAIVFGTGKIKMRDMVVAGSLFDLLGAVLAIAFTLLIML